jgi:acyl-coenzyme A thioesterase PaaI-like protein
MTRADLAAQGWERLSATAFSNVAGPFWRRRESDGASVVGFLAEEHHSNGHLGLIHGGAMMTFADVALGIAAVDAIGKQHCATSQLSYSFAGAGRVGDFVTCRPELVRRTRALVFVRGLVKVGDKVVGSADGIFTILDPAKLEQLRAGA